MNGEATAKVFVCRCLAPLDVALSTCRQDLCATVERELRDRGCQDYSVRASQLLDTFEVKKSLTVKDYFKGLQDH